MIFQIGFNKCATTALFWLFEGSGYRSLHSSGRRSRRASHPVVSRQHPQILIHHNICAGLPPVHELEDFTAFFDMEYDRPDTEIKIENFKHFDRLAGAYPDARFILNIRDRDRWLRSRARHNEGMYLKRSMRRYGLTEEATLARWGDDFDRHNDRVREFFRAEEDRLLTFHIEEDDIDRLVAFCAPDVVLDPGHWRMSRNTDAVLARKRG